MVRLDVWFIGGTCLLNAYALRYVYKLGVGQVLPSDLDRSCACALTRTRTALLCYLVASLLVTAALTGLYARGLRGLYRRLAPAYLVCSVPLSVVYMVLTYAYVRELKQKECACARTMDGVALQALGVLTGVVSSAGALAALLGAAAAAYLVVSSSSARRR